MLKQIKYTALFCFIAVFASSCSQDVWTIAKLERNEGKEDGAALPEITMQAVPEQAMIENVPFVRQMPELARGCEVTSLTMLLRHAGANTDKMTLAKEVARVPFQANGLRGDPNEGFVGDMYTFSKPGYGVYHRPIYNLAKTYFPNRAVNLTGSDAKEIYKTVAAGSPVWIITNATFGPLGESEFRIWKTKSGEVKITYYEHSVVIIGYDTQFVYVNDPLASSPRTALPRPAFEAAWEQMGSQAIAIMTK